MRRDGVAIGSRDFKRTVRIPDVDVLAHMSPEVLLLFIALEIVMELANSRQLEQRGFGFLNIFLYNDFM